jgi:hypothetical protein
MFLGTTKLDFIAIANALAPALPFQPFAIPR